MLMSKSQVAALQDMSSGTSVDTHDAEQTEAELDAVMKQIEELRRNLADVDASEAGSYSNVGVMSRYLRAEFFYRDIVVVICTSCMMCMHVQEQQKGQAFPGHC